MSNETGLKQAILSFSKCKVLLVELPEGATVQDSGCGAVLYWNKEYTREKGDSAAFYPFGIGSGKRLHLLGKLSELTEEQFAGIVEIMDTILNEDDTESFFYRDYRTEDPDLGQFSARQSFLSKMQAEGYYTDNPAGSYEECVRSLPGGGCFAYEESQFSLGEARTFPPDQTYVFIIHKQQT